MKQKVNPSFDNIATTYDIELENSLSKFYSKDIGLFAEYKIKLVASKLSKNPKKILEFGCGTGNNNSFMKKWFPESIIYGCDVSEKSLEIAHKRNPDIKYILINNPDDLSEFYEEPFDCIFVSNVFHHIPFNEHQMWVNTLFKILSKGGNIFVFEHNPFNPITKHIFNTSDIDTDAIMLKPSYCLNLFQKANFTKIKQKYTLFFVWRNAFFEFVERIICRVPLGAQYYVWGIK